MQSKDEISKWVIEMVACEFGFSTAALRAETRLLEDLDLDSIDAIDLAVRIEEKTRLALTGTDLQSIETIQDIVDLIHERL
jgi:acyl carrier protein